MKRERLTQKQRKKQILETALSIAEEKGYQSITRQEIADRIGMSYSLVSFYFNTARIMRDAVLTEAIRTENLRIVAQASLTKDTSWEISPKLRKKAINYILTTDD